MLIFAFSKQFSQKMMRLDSTTKFLTIFVNLLFLEKCYSLALHDRLPSGTCLTMTLTACPAANVSGHDSNRLPSGSCVLPNLT